MNCRDCKLISYGIYGYGCIIPNHKISEDLKLCRYFEKVEKMTKNELWENCNYNIECCLCTFCLGNFRCIHPDYIKEQEEKNVAKKQNYLRVNWDPVNRAPKGYKINERGNIVMDFSVPRCRYCTYYLSAVGCTKEPEMVALMIENPEIVTNCPDYVIDDSKWPQTTLKVRMKKMKKEVDETIKKTIHDDRQARHDQFGAKTTWDRTQELEARKKEKIDAGFIHTSVGGGHDHYHDYNKCGSFSNSTHNDDLDAVSSGKGLIMPGTITFNNIKGETLPINSEDEMVIIDKEIKDKERQINKILETRKTFIENFFESFEDLDEKVVNDHLFNWGVRDDFLKFLLTKVNKKNRKKAKKLFNRLRFYDIGIEFSFKGSDRTNVTRLDGENWFVVKKLIAMIKKYGCVYINDVFQTKYSDLASHYDTLVFDDEKAICESCGTENDCIAIYCNNCGRRL